MNIKVIIKHIAIAIGIVLVLGFVTLQILKIYTHHGESVEVPNLKGMKLEKAVLLLDGQEVLVEVIDSIYDKSLAPGIVVEQTPVAGSKIKKHREIYLVINSYFKPQITIPDVRDLSYRNARATLEAIGFEIKNVEYVPSEYKNLVKDVKMNGRILMPGTKIEVESALTLVVGGKPSDTEVVAPSLHGLRYEEAISRLYSDSLNIRSVVFEGAPRNRADSLQYVIYKQNPIKGSPMHVGGSINIWLTKDKSLLDLPEEEYDATLDSIRKLHPKDIEDFGF